MYNCDLCNMLTKWSREICIKSARVHLIGVPWLYGSVWSILTKEAHQILAVSNCSLVHNYSCEHVCL